MKVPHYQIIKLSKFVAIILVISKSRASVIKDATLLVLWAALQCSIPADIALVVKSTTFVSRMAKSDSNIQ